MKKRFRIVLVSLLAVACAAGVALAAGGKVLSVDGEKVVVEAKGAGLAVGASGEIKGAGGSVTGKVTSVAGDKVTFQVIKGKASSLKAGESVTVDSKAKAAEATQGC